jgi:DNA-binding NarL/FixJ family response regulator
MDILVLTPVRILGDGLTACIALCPGNRVIAVARDVPELRDALMLASVDVVLVDVTQGIDLYDVRSVAAEHPNICLVALGLHEQRHDVIRCGRAGFAGYIPRDASAEVLLKSLNDAVLGRLACSAEISGSLLRALFKTGADTRAADPESALTRRETQVLRLLGRGFTNKEIARDLDLSVATVKHHVHHVLGKLQVRRRAQAMRRVQDSPWIAS